MDTTVGIHTMTGDKIYHHVHHISYRDGFLTIDYKEQGRYKRAILEMEYIISFVVG